MVDPLNSRKLTTLKRIHAAIYILIVVAIFYVLYAAITKTYGVLLYVAVAILIIEAIARIATTARCPLTDLAKRYGDPKGYAGSSLFSERFSKYMFWFFGLIGIIAVVVLILDILKIR